MAKTRGRPTKLTTNWLSIAEQVLDEDINAIVFTDKELREEINDRISQGLADKDAAKVIISDTTFESWKRGDLKDPMGLIFLRLYKKALRFQKANLFVNLRKDEKAWQKYAWIIERKFEDWNLRSVQDISSKQSITYNIKTNL